jgi:methyl-accepting chemotaxis protein
MRSISFRLLMWIGATALVLIIGAVVITNNLKQSMLDDAIKDYVDQQESNLQSLVSSKLASGLGASTAISSDSKVRLAINTEDHVALGDNLAKVSKEFVQKTEYKNIGFLVVDADGKILLSTYVNEDDGLGKDATYRAGVKDVLSGKKTSFTNIDLSSGGLILSSMVPINGASGQVLAVFEFSSGFGTINDELLARGQYHVAILNDIALKTFKQGKDNKKLGSFVVAHNKQFRDKVQDWYAKLPVDQIVATKGVWQDAEHVAKAFEIHNAKGDVIGFHLLGFDKSILTKQVEKVDSITTTLEVIMVVMMIVIMLVVWLAVRRQVSLPIAAMQQQLATIQKSGVFSSQINGMRDDEMGQIACSINALLAMLSQSLGSVNSVLKEVAKGDFRQRIDAQLPGDLDMLKDNLNTAVSALQHNMMELSHAMDALSRGEFSYRMDSNVEPHMRAKVDNALINLSDTIYQINDSMQAMAAGNFSRELTMNAQGEWISLRDGINNTVHALRTSMDELATAAAAMSNGDLTVQIQGQYYGELQRISKAFNHGVRSLNDSMVSISQASGLVAHAAAEVATGNTDLSSRTQTQVLTLEKTSTSMANMTTAVAQTADNAQHARALAANTQQAAELGVKLMDQTVTAMREISEANQRITSIVSLIDSIAFQTNLLALNAAVEAARAGEHGRGFAVVAGEVRALAGKSADAAKDIKSVIDQITVKVHAGDVLVMQTVEAFANIQARLSETDQAIVSIANAMREQSDGVTTVNRSMNEIDQATQQNAALVEETSAAAETMSSQAHEVQERIARFRLTTSGSVLALQKMRR